MFGQVAHFFMVNSGSKMFGQLAQLLMDIHMLYQNKRKAV